MRNVAAAVDEPCHPGDVRPVVGSASTALVGPRAAAGGRMVLARPMGCGVRLQPAGLAAADEECHMFARRPFAGSLGMARGRLVLALRAGRGVRLRSASVAAVDGERHRPYAGRPVVESGPATLAGPLVAARGGRPPYLWSDQYRVRNQFDAAGVSPTRPCPRRRGPSSAEAARKAGSS